MKFLVKEFVFTQKACTSSGIFVKHFSTKYVLYFVII